MKQLLNFLFKRINEAKDEKLLKWNQITFVDYLIFFGTLFFTLYYKFASYALENMNEGLYAEIPREMLETGNYIIPHLNYVPYLEKPPFMYWLITLSYHIFGINEFAARIIPVTMGALTCVILFYFLKHLRLGRIGWFAGIILGTSVGFILISRVIIFDSTLTFFFTAALLTFYFWYEKEKKYFLWLSYICIGLAFLTKGILAVALIPLIALIFMIWTKTPKKKMFSALDPIGIFLFFLIVGPWLLLAIIGQQGFAYDFFINEQVMRFLNKRIPHDYHTGPIYYYVLPLFIMIVPWTAFLINLCKKEKNHIIQHPQITHLKKFSLVWFLTVLSFFSLSSAKAVYYIVIGMPGLTLLIGIKIYEFLENNDRKSMMVVFFSNMLIILSLLIVINSGFFFSGAKNFLPDDLIFPDKYKFTFLFLNLIVIAYGCFVYFLNRYKKWSAKQQFLAISFLVFPFILFLVHDKQQLQHERSQIFMAQYIKENAPNAPVYLYKDYEEISSILFYVQKRVSIIDSVSRDLYFGSTTPAAKGWFIPFSQFIQDARHQKIFVVVKKNYLQEFQNRTKMFHFKIVDVQGETYLLEN